LKTTTELAPIDYHDPRLPDRFWAKVCPCPVTGCWLWSANTVGEGYGAFRIGSKTDGSRRSVRAHVLAYTVLSGPVVFELDHACRQKACCNPEHLEDVPHRENVMRGNSPLAEQARRTRCKRGDHPLSGDNLIITPIGGRRCRTCTRTRQRAYARAKRAAA
jgi:hypothetical protein